MTDRKWFLDRIGKKVKAYSRFQGRYSFPVIKNRNMAIYLHAWYHEYKKWLFCDLNENIF